MRVLIVAPRQEDLQFQQPEVQRLANTFAERKLLIDDVTCANVLDAITEYKPDILWFTTHGNYDGIVLEDCLIDGNMLSSSLRGTGTKLIVLNTCESRAIAERIYAQTGCHVVATIGAVEDRHALFVGQRFAVLVASGSTYAEAYRLAKSDKFVYVPESMTNNTNNTNGYEGLRRIVAELQMQVDRRDEIIEKLRVDMSALMLKFVQLQESQEARFRAMQESQDKKFRATQTSLWVLAVLVIIVLLVQLSQVLQ